MACNPLLVGYPGRAYSPPSGCLVNEDGPLERTASPRVTFVRKARERLSAAEPGPLLLDHLFLELCFKSHLAGPLASSLSHQVGDQIRDLPVLEACPVLCAKQPGLLPQMCVSLPQLASRAAPGDTVRGSVTWREPMWLGRPQAWAVLSMGAKELLLGPPFAA